MADDPLVIHNVTLVDADGQRESAWLAAQGGLITATGADDTWRDHSAHAHVVDGAGGNLTPAFTDIHVHGGGGYSHTGRQSDTLAVLDAHRRHGTGRAVASFVAAPVTDLCAQLASAAALSRHSPQLLGSHLEGPSLASSRKGAHSAHHLIDPDPRVINALLRAADGTLVQVTLDPLRHGAEEATRTLVDAGVVVAIGHTEANYEQTLTAFGWGVSLVTHAFNAMPGLHHRDPGPLLAAIDTPSVSLELILDGLHVHPRMATLLFQLAPHRVVLVTDAMAAAGAASGDYRLGEKDVTVADGRAVLRGTQTLAGSTLTQDAALALGIGLGIPAHHLIEALTLTPSRALRLDGRTGSLAIGARADLNLFTPDWRISDTYSMC